MARGITTSRGASKKDLENCYKKTEVDSKLSDKADKAALGTQVTYSLSGTTLTITTK